MTREQQLRLKYRTAIDLLDPHDLIIPSDVVARKSSHFYIVSEDVPRDVAFELVKLAIGEALSSVDRRELTKARRVARQLREDALRGPIGDDLAAGALIGADTIDRLIDRALR